MSKRTKFILGIGAIAALVIGWQVAAFAVHNTGAFELEGNASSSTTNSGPPDDWDRVCHEVLKNDCSTSFNTNGASAVDWVSEPNLNSTIFTGGGSKDPIDIGQWAWKDGAGGLPDKDNLLHSFAARYPSTSEGDVLFFGSDRYDNSGDAQQGFWFFQNSIGLGSNSVGGGTGFTGVHKDGDLLVISDFSNGGTTSTITVYKWDSTCKKTTGSTVGKCGDANLRIAATSNSAKCGSANPDTACGIVNPTNGTTAPWPYTDKSGNHTYLQGEFFEGGVNLTALGLQDRCFASVASETRSSTSTTATLKDFVLGNFGKCGSSTTTQQSVTGPADPTSTYPSTQIGSNGSVSVSDSATVGVSGGATNFNGTVQFHLRGPIGSPLEASTDIGSPMAVSNGTPTVNSNSATVTAAGDYCWSAHFTSSTTGVPDSNDDGTNECFTVTPRTPPLDTQAVANPVDFGNPVQDNATLSGTANQPGTPVINPQTQGGPAGGTIKFTLLKADCSTLATGTGSNPQTVNVSGDATYGPVSFTPDAPGTYHWKAEYIPATGDPNNIGSTHNGNCTDTDETVVVNQQNSTISSTQEWVPNDTATVNHGGTATFTLLKNATVTDDHTCSGGSVIYGPATKTLSGSGNTFTASSTNTTKVTSVTANDTYTWKIEVPATGSFKAVTSCAEATQFSSLNNGGTVTSP